MTTNATSQVVNDIRDIKPPLDIYSVGTWVEWGLVVVAVLAAVYLLWRWWQQRKANAPLPPPVPPHIRAKQKLVEALAWIGEPKRFCIVVSDTVRIYLEERFRFHAPERTTEEFLRELSATDLLSPEQKESLGRFLESCDLVKFAKYEPGETELRDLHSAAVRLVEETEETAESETPPPQPDFNAAGESTHELPAATEIANRKS